MKFQLTETILLFIGLLGFVLAFVCFFISKISSTIKISLSALLLIISLIVIIGTINFTGNTIHLIHVFRLESPLHYLLSPALFFYTLTLINTSFQFRKIHLLHLLPFIINIIYFIPFYLTPTADKTLQYLNFIEKGSVILPFQYLTKTIIMVGYFVFQVYLIKKYAIFNLLKSETKCYLCYWFILFLGAQLFLLIGLIIEQSFEIKIIKDPYEFAIYMIALFQFIILIGLLVFPVLLYGNTLTQKKTSEKYLQSRLNEEDKNEILNKLVNFMKNKDKPYLNEKITLSSLADLLKISPQELSQVINEKEEKNFNDFINSYRIEEAKALLTSSSIDKLTIEAIASKAGFNSKSAFYSAFKKQTGQTPKDFLNSNNKEKRIAVS